MRIDNKKNKNTQIYVKTPKHEKLWTKKNKIYYVKNWYKMGENWAAIA